MSAKHGIDSFLGRNSASWASPTWVELECVVSVTPNAGWQTAEIKTRASRVTFGAKVGIPLEFTTRVLCDDADAGYTALLAAFQSLTAVVDMIVLDGPTTTVGSFGYRANFQVAEGSQEQPPDDVLYRDFKMVPYPDSVNKPQWAQVTSGPAITYTTI